MQINQRKQPSQAHRKRTDKYYTSQRHRLLRAAALKRDRFKCRSCGFPLNERSEKGSPHTAFGDHIVPRDFIKNTSKERLKAILSKLFDPEFVRELMDYGPDILVNYQSLCKSCHDSKSTHDKTYYQ